MSQLSKKTERNALKHLAKCLSNFDKLDKLKMTSIDAFEARQAENYILSILNSNNYSSNHKAKSKKQVTKSHNHYNY